MPEYGYYLINMHLYMQSRDSFREPEQDESIKAYKPGAV